MLPAVPSTIVPPGFSSPRFSASQDDVSAARSLTEPPGIEELGLAEDLAAGELRGLRRRISGVLPIAADEAVADVHGNDKAASRARVQAAGSFICSSAARPSRP